MLAIGEANLFKTSKVSLEEGDGAVGKLVGRIGRRSRSGLRAINEDGAVGDTSFNVAKLLLRVELGEFSADLELNVADKRTNWLGAHIGLN